MSDDDLTTLLQTQSSRPPLVSGVKAPYQRFLDTLLTGQHPPFCELVWNGETFHVVLQLHFQKATRPAPAPDRQGEASRREAWQQFKGIGPAQQPRLYIRVNIKHGLPVTAEVTVKPEAAGPLDFQTP